jgi:hypothetical protein
MVWCPPGEFLMGSPSDEKGRDDDETQHRVTLTRGFWLAKTELGFLLSPGNLATSGHTKRCVGQFLIATGGVFL